MTFVDANEQLVIDLLATFARTIGPGAMAAQVIGATNGPAAVPDSARIDATPAPNAAPEGAA
jgi:hypothetical protein